MAEARVRRLGVADLEALFSLAQAAEPHSWSEEALLVELVHEDAVVLAVVDDADAPQAFMIVRQLYDELWILNIGTHPRARRRGHADQLLALAAVRPQSLSPQSLSPLPTSLWLEVRAGNVAAKTLYQKHSFVVVGERAGYYPGRDGGPREAALVMRRSLG
jgi:ribosomal-protein-alanine N-acetyltransferase